MYLRVAIKELIAGIGILMLLAVAVIVAQPGSTHAAEGYRDRAATRKSENSKVRLPVRADKYLRDEFGASAIHIEPAAATQLAHPASDPAPETKSAVPLHGFGTFEGVVLVAPAGESALRGMILVEPAAETAPVMESSDDIDIPADLSAEQDDPWEDVNRLFFGVNEVLDHLVLEPAARIYHGILPEPVRDGISNAVRNASSPVILANDILQGNRQGASDTIVRFMVNSTLGIGGLFDPAGHMGVQYHREDFGQTLAVWGVGAGPYMVVPVLGPSNPRDFAGMVVDTAFNPLTWILLDAPLPERLAPSGVELLVGREAILDDYATLRKSSPDLYSSVRDIYGDKRQTEISNGDVTGEPIPDVTSLPPTSVMTTVKPF